MVVAYFKNRSEHTNNQNAQNAAEFFELNTAQRKITAKF
jgi:hypothetical protein